MSNRDAEVSLTTEQSQRRLVKEGMKSARWTETEGARLDRAAVDLARTIERIVPISCCFKFAVLLSLTLLPVNCCRVSQRRTEQHEKEEHPITWNSNYVAKPE